MNLELYGVVISALGLIYLMIRNFRTDVNGQFKSIHEDLVEIRERLSFLEASSLYTMPLEPAQLNPRSAAAREMWKKRKAKKLEKKE